MSLPSTKSIPYFDSLAQSGRCCKCGAQMPDALPGCNKTKVFREHATKNGWSYATFPDSNLISFWWCPDCKAVSGRQGRVFYESTPGGSGESFASGF